MRAGPSSHLLETWSGLLAWCPGSAFWPQLVVAWTHASGTPWVRALRQPRAARRAVLLPGSVLATGHLCPGLPCRASSVPSSHQAFSCGTLGAQSSLWTSLPRTLFHPSPAPALWGLQTGRKPGSLPLLRPSLPRPTSRVQPQAAALAASSQRLLPCCFDGT